MENAGTFSNRRTRPLWRRKRKPGKAGLRSSDVCTHSKLKLVSLLVGVTDTCEVMRFSLNACLDSFLSHSAHVYNEQLVNLLYLYPKLDNGNHLTSNDCKLFSPNREAVELTHVSNRLRKYFLPPQRVSARLQKSQ